MRRILIAAGAFALCAGAVSAADESVMTPMFGNTIVVVDKNGMESHTHYNADHTFDGMVPSMSYKYGGTWMIDDKGQLCRNFDPPVPGRTNPDCDPATAHAVGDSWTSPDGAKGSLVSGVN